MTTASVRVVFKVGTIALLLWFAALPVYWMLVTAFQSNEALFASPPELLPQPAYVTNIVKALSETGLIGRWIWNSFIIATGTALISVLLAAPAAYAISRFRFKGRGSLSLGLFVTQMLPEALLVVPLFTLFLQLGLLNSLFGLALADAAFVMPVAVWILVTAIDGIPPELEESARIDGCPPIAIPLRVVFPLVRPALAAATVVTFFAGWNEYLFAVQFITDAHRWPASVGLASFTGEYLTPLNLVMSAALLFSLPAIAFFLILQRQIVSGLTAGSVKG